MDDGTSSVMGSNPWQAEALSYDSEGRLAEKWVWTGDKANWTYHLNYEYNRAGELTRQKLTAGGETLYHHYTYNKRGLLDKVYLSDDGTADTEPAEITYFYTASGSVDQIDYRGGTTLTNGYDIRERLTDINDINSTSGSPFAAKYSYLKNSNVDEATYWNPNITTDQNLTNAHREYSYEYNYDGLNRLTGADYTLNSSNPNAFDVPSISYDGAGNIETLQRRDQSGVLVDDLDYKYENGNNQLSSLDELAGSTTAGWDAEAGTFSYDGNGNLTSMTGNPHITSISYDHRNQATRTVLNSGNEQIAGYNGDGQRVLKEVQTSGGTTWAFYLRDGTQTLGMIADGSLQYLNIFGNDGAGRVIADTSGAVAADGVKRYYIKDLIGSTRAVVDQTGDVKENRDYYPFGLLMPGRSTTSGNTIEKFTGKELDDATGLYHFGARVYDAALARWNGVDPLADKYPEWSPYNYTLNNPILYIDPNGEDVFVSFEDEDARKAFRAFLQTDVGREFIGSFAKAGKLVDANDSDIVYAEFDSDGTNSDHILSFGEFDNYGAAAGTTSYDFYSNGEYVSDREVRNNFKEISKDSRLAISISLNLAYKSEDIERYGSAALGLGETLSHEAFLHAGVQGPALINRLNGGDLKGVRTYLQDQYQNNLRGSRDHRQARNRTHPNLDKYINAVKQLNQILTGN